MTRDIMVKAFEAAAAPSVHHKRFARSAKRTFVFTKAKPVTKRGK